MALLPSIVEALSIPQGRKVVLVVVVEAFGQELQQVECSAIFLEAELGHHTTHGEGGVDLHTPITLAPDGAHHTAAAVATEALQDQGQGPLQGLEAPVDDDLLEKNNLNQ